MLRARPARSAAVPRNLGHIRTLADQALSRAAGAPLIGGNRVKLLRDALVGSRGDGPAADRPGGG